MSFKTNVVFLQLTVWCDCLWQEGAYICITFSIFLLKMLNSQTFWGANWIFRCSTGKALCCAPETKSVILLSLCHAPSFPGYLFDVVSMLLLNHWAVFHFLWAVMSCKSIKSFLWPILWRCCNLVWDSIKQYSQRLFQYSFQNLFILLN